MATAALIQLELETAPRSTAPMLAKFTDRALEVLNFRILCN
jgi:hypothetical protein